MIKYILMFLLVPSVCFAGGLSVRGSGYVDYCKDANNKGCWRMDEDTNTAHELDISGNNGHITTSGSPSYVTGIEGNALDFEKDNSEYGSIPDGGATDISGANQEISMCAWVKLESNIAGDKAILGKFSFGNDNRSYVMQGRRSITRWRASISSDGTNSGTTTATGGTNYSTGVWYHVCMVYNDIDIRVYLDGVLDSNGSENPAAHTSGIFNSAGNFCLGCSESSFSPTNFWDGLIDEAGIWDRALSAEEILDIYNNGLK